MNAAQIVTLAASLLLAPAAHAAPEEIPAVPTTEAWRADRPQSPAPPAPVLPTFQSTKLGNGLTVYVTTLDALPLVSFQLVTRGGATLDPAGAGGLTAITYAMLQEGAGGRTALEFSDRAADLGATFGARSDRDHGVASIGGLLRNADPMLELLADGVLRPTLANDDFTRVKQQTIAALERRRGSPQGLAFERIPELIYGEGHPYGHPPTGTPQTVADLTADAVRAHYPKVFGPADSALVVAGAIDLAQAKALAEKHFGAWDHKAAPRTVVPAVEAKPRTTLTFVDKAPAPQTMVVMGRPLFARGHPDEQALAIANEVYGGAFSSRLNMNLREAKGYTYGAGSQTAHRAGVGVFVAFSALRQDATALGLKEFFVEMEGMIERPASAAELGAAKAGIIRSLPGEFETISDIAGAAAALFIYDLPLDHFATVGAKYEAVTAADVQRVVEQYLVPSTMQILLVGDAKVVAASVEALGLGQVVRSAP